MIRTLLLVLALAGAWLAAPLAAQPQFPALSGRVVDSADILSPEDEAALTAKLAALETQSQRQLVVATVPDLQGYDISDYGYQLGRAWGLGDETRNDGALLIVAPNDRKVRIEVGYGLEGYLTDALSALIIQNQILPAFRDGDFAGGITAGTDAITAQLQLSPEEAARVAAEAGEARESGGFPFGMLIWLAFMFFFFVLPILAGRGRRRKYRAKGSGPWGKRDLGDTARDVILWEVGSAIARGMISGGGRGGGGFGGGGGFSGGGGSFGGGGASGGW
ncbi:TPM domain-containing protein [Erythrobacter sp. R86502]|uniref:TPM domain-containing protein n=1 Tax=Erythrobacter sp. R86502 TaxID=3093846 RepID=UPI0036D394CD